MSARHAHALPRRTGLPRTLSVVLPVLNEADSLRLLLPSLQRELACSGLEWEIVIVDDGSNDDLQEVIGEFERRVPINLQFIRLSRNFGKEAALTAGLAAARGDGVLTMDGDGQHPVALIGAMLERWRAGCQVVAMAQTQRALEPRWLAMAKRAFYRFLQGGERFTITPGAGDFRLLDRRVVDALLQMPERTRFMKGLYAWLGFRSEVLPFEAAQRTAGQSKFRLRGLLALASLGITSFSLKPLRMVSGIGALISLAALAYGVYILVETLVVGNAVSGWATLASGMMLLSGIQLMCLGVIAEYLGRVFEEAKQRPLYIVDQSFDHSALGTPVALPLHRHHAR